MTALLIYTAIVVALALSTIRHPATAIAGVICMFGLEQWAQGSHPLFVQHPSLTNYAIGFIVLLGLAKKIYRGQPILRGYPAVGLLVFTLFLYALVSTRWAPYPEQSLNSLLSTSPYIITNIFLAPLLCSNVEDISRALSSTLALGSLLLFLLLFTVEWEYRYIVFPGAGFHGNPAAIGGLGGTMFLLAAYFTWNRFKLLNVLKWVIVVLGLLLAIRSGSRGQTLGTIMALLAFWPVAYRLRNLRAYLLLGLGIVLIAAAQLAILCAVLFYYFLLSLKQGNLVGSSLLFMCAILIGKFYKLVSDSHRLIEMAKQHHSGAGHDQVR